MKHIWTRQFRILSDPMAVYQFMTEIYEKDWRNGVPAPFYEYALSSGWMDKSYTYLNRLWLDGDQIVGFVFTENPVTDIYFSLRPGYEMLAEEMVAYAHETMPDFDHNRQFILFQGQTAIAEAASAYGYQKVAERADLQFDFSGELNFKLPEGFHFVPYEQQDIRKRAICNWKGFDHEASRGPWKEDDKYIAGTEWTPANALKTCYQIRQAPHQTCQYDVVIANEDDEYVCSAGMWWVKENQLDYMDPLCPVPAYRGRGLAPAALSAPYRRMKRLGATHMTGGDNPFYRKIGYQRSVTWTYWKRGS